MRLTARPLALLLALAAFGGIATAQSTYVFQLNQAQSNFTWTGTSSIGPILGNPSNQFQLLGTQNMDILLQSGAQPFATGAFSGGAVQTNTGIHGRVPGPFGSSLATIDVVGLGLTATSPAFTVGAGGAFTANMTITATSGTMTVTPLVGAPSTQNLAGSTSTPTAVNGTLTYSANGWHLSGPVNSTFPFSDPTSGTTGSITLVGTIVADFSLVKTFCFGDGSGAACPCGNSSSVGSNSGCLNSTGVGGQLTSTGVAAIGADTFTLNGANLPGATTGLFFQGSAQQSAGAGLAFGDGLRCVSGTVIRLGTKVAVAGALSYPVGADPTVSVKGLVTTPGATNTYQIWYRNAAAYCTPQTFNLSNGLSVVWMP
jgi:hypothetical protein